jgi:hypothetical protein
MSGHFTNQRSCNWSCTSHQYNKYSTLVQILPCLSHMKWILFMFRALCNSLHLQLCTDDRRLILWHRQASVPCISTSIFLLLVPRQNMRVRLLWVSVRSWSVILLLRSYLLQIHSYWSWWWFTRGFWQQCSNRSVVVWLQKQRKG